MDAEKALEAIETARNTGKIRRGANEVTKAIERGLAKLAVVALDVSPLEVIMHIKPLAEEKGVPYVEVKTKEELGVAAGIGVPTAAVAIVKEGDAAGMIKDASLEQKAQVAESKAEKESPPEKKAQKPKESKPAKPAKDSEKTQTKESKPADKPKESKPAKDAAQETKPKDA